jgi:cell division protease FtsH
MHYLEHHDPPDRVSIVPHGTPGGNTRSLHPEDWAFLTRSQLKAMLAAALGGHAAELVVFGDVASGGESDIASATDIARRMVTEYGMSDRLGTVALRRSGGTALLGRPLAERRTYSERTAEAIDEEVRCLIGEGYERAKSIVYQHRSVLDRLAAELIQHDTLDADALQRVFRATC